MAASRQDLVRAIVQDKSYLSTSLKGLEATGLITIGRTPRARENAST
jgi:DNA-binding MarR family transcriptional regulator